MRFVHTADWHVGKPYSRIRDQQKRAIAQNERIDAIKRIGRFAREEAAEFVLVAGDLFDSPYADKSTVAAACSAIGEIEVPVFVIPGNHDHGGPGSVWEQEFFRREKANLAPNLTVLLESTPQVLDSVVLLPCPLLRRRCSTDPTTWLRSQNVYNVLPAGKPRIVLAHGSATNDFSGRWGDGEEESSTGNKLDLSGLPESEIDYLALGDWHGTKMVHPKGWYAGTPELDKFAKGGDHDPGNILLVEVQRGEQPQVTKRTSTRLQWNELSFDFTDDKALNEFGDRITSLLGQRANEDFLRLSLSGSVGIEASSRVEELLESLEARLLMLELADHTRIAPTDAEIDDLCRRASDPLIANVAGQLVERAARDEDDAHVARIALRELHAACMKEAGS